MASNFSFQPMGLSSQFTVTAASSTLSFVVTTQGGTTLTVGTSGNYMPGCVRLVNQGTIAVQIAFGAATVTVATTTGIVVLPNTVEVFTVRGNQFMATISGGTSTLNITYGEGM